MGPAGFDAGHLELRVHTTHDLFFELSDRAGDSEDEGKGGGRKEGGMVGSQVLGAGRTEVMPSIPPSVRKPMACLEKEEESAREQQRRACGKGGGVPVACAQA